MTARIVLAVRESEYIEPLLHYLHHSEYGEIMRITAFSRLDAFMEFMTGDELPDAVAGDPSFIEAWLVEGRSTVPWAVLTEAGELSERGDLAGGRRIAKYQALPSLLEAILQLSDLKRIRTAALSKEATLLLGVVSASGGSGKTTVALNMAKQLGATGLSVFYLNLESVDSSGFILRMPGSNVPGMERLLYELKAGGAEHKGGRGKPKWGDYVFRHDSLRCDAFRPVENFKEMLQMSQQDTLELLEGLAGAGSYDVIIVDTGSIEEERAQAVLHRCGVLLWVLKNEQVSIRKTERWIEYMASPHSGMPPELMNKSRLVLNNCTGAENERLPSSALKLDAVLPYIPSWGLQHYGELCLNSPQFIDGIQELCRGIVEPALPGVFTGSSV
ncbi:hypothetical protein KDC22_06005 [Paenibacillus tritici]|uniref:hypothetical protein n=1 Tax=Paenibacillus tritici TaxID=1873425 RepID=UPI001BA90644|nr:hypothetical protein [Paenibacillus tritici]QUL56086.1 hypothetical protein KDC22_06005 [Paenibacillus tritici]